MFSNVQFQPNRPNTPLYQRLDVMVNPPLVSEMVAAVLAAHDTVFVDGFPAGVPGSLVGDWCRRSTAASR